MRLHKLDSFKSLWMTSRYLSNKKYNTEYFGTGWLYKTVTNNRLYSIMRLFSIGLLKTPRLYIFLFNTTHSIQWFTMTAIASRDAINVMQRMGSHVLLFASTHCDPSPVTSLHRNNDITPLIAILLQNNYESKHMK